MAARDPVPPSDGTVESLGADVVHFPFQSGFRTAIPTIYQPHDLQHLHLPKNFLRSERLRRERTYRALCLEAAAVSVGTQWVRRDLLEHYHLEPDTVWVIPLAPMFGVYAAAHDDSASFPQFELPDRFALYPAQTWKHKNHVMLLRALRILRDRGLLVPLLATGATTNHYERTLRPLIRDLDLESQVRFTGFLHPGTLRRLHEAARIVVIPTLFESASGPSL